MGGEREEEGEGGRREVETERRREGCGDGRKECYITTFLPHISK
jgi:hypothetical protein